MRKDSKSFDAVIAGAGMAGVNLAVALAEAGKKVMVFDRSGIKGQSSPAAGGILDPFLEMKPGSPLFLLSKKAFLLYPAFIRRIERKSGMKVGYKKTGMIFIARDLNQQKDLRRRYQWHRKTGIEAEWVTQKQILNRYPFVARNCFDGLYYPSIGRVHPDRLLNALKSYARKLGVVFIKSKSSFRVLLQKNEIQGVCIGTRKIPARFVINAAGAWSGSLKIPGIMPQVFPAKGQILLYKADKWKCGTIMHTVDGGYLVPWGNQTYLAGSTVEHVGFNSSVTKEGKAVIQKKVQSIIPEAKAFRVIKSWAGLRPFSKDYLPWIGRTNIKGLYLATGYYRSGILISPLVGKLLAQQIMTGKSVDSLKPFEPFRRFNGTAQ